MSNPEVRLVIRIDIFISSPGDLGEEREIVKRVVEKLNRSSLKNDYFFVPFLFEDEVPPEIGESAQLIVDRYMQVQNSYILVSMFWTRMGTPFTIIDTNERYESGTQYEFLKGYEHFQKANHPHILLYRKQKENPKADPAQKQKVEAFFDGFIGDPPKLKGLFARYTEPAELEDKIEEHILKIIEAYPPQPEDFNRIEAPEFKEEPRRIDAAMPRETAVDRSTPVQVMICLPDSAGLEAFLPKRAGKDEVKKKDVRKGGLTIAFPVDKKTGKVQPALVKIELETDDFKVKNNSTNVRLEAGSDSGQISFNVIPIKPSRKSLLIVKVKSMALDGSEIECGSVVLSTMVKGAMDPIPIPMVWNLVSRSLATAAVSADRHQEVGAKKSTKSIHGKSDKPTPRRLVDYEVVEAYRTRKSRAKGAGGGVSLIALEGIGPSYADKLKKAGAASSHRLLLSMGATAAGRKSLAQGSGIDPELILEWVNRADLFRIKGIGEGYADLLENIGVDSMVELSRRNPRNLLAMMMKLNAEKNLVHKLPSLSQVEAWVAQARKLPRTVSY